MKSRQLTCTLLVVAVGTSAGCGFDYSRWISQKVKEALGDDFRGYQPFSYPTDNFGLATIYTPDGSQVTDEEFYCDTWECLGLERPEDAGSRLGLAGFAAVGERGGTIALDEKEQKDFALNGVLPPLFSAVGLSGEYQKNRIVQTQLVLGRAYPRKLRRTRMVPYLRSLPPDNELRRAFDRGDLAIVVGDVVIEGLKVDVSLSEQLATAVDAKLAANPSGFFEGPSLGVKLAKAREGQYSFEVAGPVIVLHFIKKQPAAGVLEEGDDWDAWGDMEMRTVKESPTAR